MTGWLIFLKAKPHILGGDTYTLLLIGLNIPFPKLVKSLSTWMQNKCFGLWKAYLQPEQLTSLGWLLFSTSSMDADLLKEAISDRIEKIPIGLCWCTINIGSQGPIPLDQQVKALHIYIDELNMNMARPLLINFHYISTSVPSSQVGHHSEYKKMAERQNCVPVRILGHWGNLSKSRLGRSNCWTTKANS